MSRKVLRVGVFSLLAAVLLCGCTGEQEDNDLTLQLQKAFLSRAGCAGTMEITADYGQRVYSYTVTFSEETGKGLSMVLTAPEEVAGITATLEEGQTFLQFDGVCLQTGPLNADGLSPLDALPACLAAMESGFVAETGREQLGETEALRLCFRDPERPAGQGLETVLWFDRAQKTLLRGELRSDGTMVVRCEFSDFHIIQ